MGQFRPVSISRGGFAFCRFVIAALVWLSIILKSTELLIVVFFIMALSTIFKVEKAPLVMIYKYTIERFIKSDKVIVDEKGIFLSHLIGSIFTVLCILLQYYGNSTVALCVTLAFAVLQTSAAFGFCSVLKLYNCMNNGTCCRVGKFAKKVRDNA